ncbi:MAG: hypothetical protein JSV65_01590 [Armatimonadota bacterium]|nr:MAG: hypothetical protein JSV65_01590 [Armatimonadota bacterium]
MRVWIALDAETREVDALAGELGAAPDALAAALLELELAGLVERRPGPRYVRVLQSRSLES